MSANPDADPKFVTNHKHCWNLVATANMEDPEGEKVLVAIWECADCHEMRKTWEPSA